MDKNERKWVTCVKTRVNYIIISLRWYCHNEKINDLATENAESFYINN